MALLRQIPLNSVKGFLFQHLQQVDLYAEFVVQNSEKIYHPK